MRGYVRVTHNIYFVKELVRWATGKRLTYRLLPKLSLITSPPLLNSGVFALRI